MSKEPEALQRRFDNGKYTVINNNGLLTALRYGAPWRDLTGDNLVAAMLHEVDRLHEVNTELLGALEYIVNTCPAIDPSGEDAHTHARYAIAKATGEQV